MQPEYCISYISIMFAFYDNIRSFIKVSVATPHFTAVISYA